MESKISAIIKMVKAIGPIYQNSANSVERKHMETTIGASLWYGSLKIYSGYCSKQLLLQQKEAKKWLSKRISEEHPFPRKLTATKLLLNHEKPQSELEEIINKGIAINYVTKVENKRLIPFQKEGVFETPEKSYRQAGIELIYMPIDMIKQVRKDISMLNKYCDKFYLKN